MSPLRLRQAITRDKCPRMKPLLSVRACQKIFIPPKDPGNHSCQPLCCTEAPNEAFVFFIFTITIEVYTGDLRACKVPGAFFPPIRCLEAETAGSRTCCGEESRQSQCRHNASSHAHPLGPFMLSNYPVSRSLAACGVHLIQSQSNMGNLRALHGKQRMLTLITA